MKIFITLLSLLALLIGCASSPIRTFAKIEIGMERADVLELVGNPLRTERFDGKEKWVYRFYEDDKAIFKQVTFDQTMKVISTGDDTEEVKRMDEIKAADQKRVETRESKKLNSAKEAAQGRVAPDIKSKSPSEADQPVMIENPNETFKPVPGID